MFWWTVAILEFTLTMCFLFLEESVLDGEGNGRYSVQPKLFVSNRIAPFFPGKRVVPHTSLADTVSLRSCQWGGNTMLMSLLRPVSLLCL